MKISAEGPLVQSWRTRQPAMLHIAAVMGFALLLSILQLAGMLPAWAVVASLSGLSLIILARGDLQLLVFSGIALLFCVAREPSPSDIFILCAFLPVAVICRTISPGRIRPALPAMLMIGGFFVVSLPGFANAMDLASAIRYYLITLYLYIFSLAIALNARRAFILLIERAYILAAALSCLAGFIGFMGFFPEFLLAYHVEMKGLFKDPNVFGPFFVPAILLLLDDIKTRERLKAHWMVHAILAGAMTVGVVLSYSRAAWINLATAAVVYFVCRQKSLHRIRISRAILTGSLLLALIAIIIMLPWFQATHIHDDLQNLLKMQEYDKGRFEAQRDGLAIAVQHPLGIGSGQFESVIYRTTGELISSHNIYIRVLSENGTAGFILFFVAIAYIIHKLLAENRLATGEEKLLSTAVLLAVLAGILVNSLVIDTLHWRHFWVFIGLSLHRIQGNREGRADD